MAPALPGINHQGRIAAIGIAGHAQDISKLLPIFSSTRPLFRRANLSALTKSYATVTQPNEF
jgi:hypothetical protein